MKIPLQAAAIMSILAVLSLTACGDDEPSEAQMKAAFKGNINPAYVIVSFTKKECHAYKMATPITKSYFCHFDVDTKPPFSVNINDGLFYVDPRDEKTWLYALSG